MTDVGMRSTSEAAAGEGGLRILTWNVNSILTVKHYHPWNAPHIQSLGFRGVLDALDAHIICLQETKLARDRFSGGTSSATNIRDLWQLALMDGHYDSYFAFSRLPGSKKAYSGVVTYIRRRDCPCLPVAAYDGLLKCRPNNNNGGSAGGEEDDILQEFSGQELEAMDAEGRCVVTDHQTFVLFNVYCPNETGPERLPFKMRYLKALEYRVSQYMRLGRQVVVAGDLNVCRSAIDHCDPVRYCKDMGLDSFDSHPAHQWLNKWCGEQDGAVIDLFRYFHPLARQHYTCWNTLINARPSNYGTRIDYILSSRLLLDCFSDCRLLTDVMGSDHCPVLATMHGDWLDRLRGQLSTGEWTAFEPQNSGTAVAYQPPPLCSANQRDLSGPSKTIKDFFKPIPKPAKATTKTQDKIIHPSISDGSTAAAATGENECVADIPAKRKVPDEFLTEQLLQSRRFWQSKLAPGDSRRGCGGSSADLSMANASTQIPVCRHKEPAKLLTVNKSGPNKGRKFYMCARPVGPASSPAVTNGKHTDKGRQLNEFRCDFFKWWQQQKK